jgi:2'-5' RNA ligase
LYLLLGDALEHPRVMRLFVGIPIPSNFFRALLRVAQNEETGKARWTPPEKAHLTLVFLGEVAEARLSSIEREVAAIHAAPLDIRVTHLDSFPRAGVLFAAVALSARLSHLHTVISSSMKGLGFPQERRPYHPHITLARFRSGEPFGERSSKASTLAAAQFSRGRGEPLSQPINFRGIDLRSCGSKKT